MSTSRITRTDLERAISSLDRAATSVGFLPPSGTALAIEMGSRTNGIAYRVAYLPLPEYQSGSTVPRSLCPLWSHGVVGRTASEAYAAITGMTYALDAVNRRQTCATIGCDNRATRRVEYGPADDRSTDSVCTECAESYLSRPALRAVDVTAGSDA